MAGLLVSAEIPNLNVLYDGPEGLLYCHFWDGKYVIHSDIPHEITPRLGIQVKKIMNAAAKVFKEKGINTLYTWAMDEDQDRYAKFFGFEPTGETVNDTFVEKDYPYPVREYKRVTE